MNRRDFLKATGLTLGAAALPRFASHALAAEADRPNVLWFSTEDISPDLGCYGDTYATTPHTDAFSAQGTRFDNAFAHMGVCAPARSGIITGMYPTSIGTNHMRCRGVPPPEARCFTEYLRAAGYYCSNHSKTDYQFGAPFTAWDAQGGNRHWRGRAEGQPFFCVINYTGTHESRARSKPADTLTHDPAKAALPPYIPDTPAARRDWAKYYDNLNGMDNQFAGVLKALEDEGLAENTIVWFWGDHGRGLPRGKRWIYDSGLKVPLMVRVPPKWRAHANADAPDAVKPGTASTNLVSFIDFAPTMLSLCNVPVPKHMQGQAFLGPQKAKPRDYIYAARDRVDEAYDIIRAVRDKRYKYIRNFMHHLPRSLDVHYMNQMPTMQDMRRLFAEGKLKGPQLQYFEQPKPVEELYDTQADPHEVNNLALDPKHEARVARMRGKLREWMKEVGDFGLLPECEFDALKHPPGANETVSAPGVTPKGDTVELTCTTPGASIAYRLDKVAAEAPPSAKGAGESLVLPAATATVHGKGLRQAPTGISSWRDTKIWLSWDIDVPKAGRLPVYVAWSCGGNARSKYTLTVGDQTLKGSSDPTGGWDKIASVKLGDVDIKKPGKITVTLKPVVKASHFQMDLRSIVIGGAMPKGAPPLAKSGNGGSDWLVYGNPITLAEGQNISVRACRIGFKDSPTVAYRQGGAAIAAEPANATPHWRDVVDKSGVIDRLLDIKQLDGQGEKAIPAYVAALSGKTRDEWGAVRYWAVVGLHRNVPEAAAKKHIGLVRAALKDESFAVRIAAAQALCDWGEEKIGLPVLIEGMKGPGQSAALLAATALGQIGEKARPAIPVLQKGKGGYVGNVCKYALMRLGKKP